MVNLYRRAHTVHMYMYLVQQKSIESKKVGTWLMFYTALY